MNNFEEPLMPPEGDGSKGRYESADLDIEELGKYLSDTSTRFEDEDAIVSILTDRYHMSRDGSIGEMKSGMTSIVSKEGIKRVVNGEEIDTDEFMQPLSGRKPRPVLRKTINTIDGKEFDLRIFEVFNRNDKFRYKYILIPVEELNQEI